MPGLPRSLLNQARNLLVFKLRYPWIVTGGNVHCQLSTRFWSPHKDIVLGNHVGIGFNCLFQADTHIGNYVMVASSCAFINSDDHRYDVIGETMWESGRGDRYKIVIGDDVWIGHGATILTPARIGRGAIVAAGSVVLEDVAPYAIVGGVPAKTLRMRFTPEQIAEHERLLNARGKLSRGVQLRAH
jgi:acetyltransferase-like isoleucine patch superfamily enzyme